MAYLWLLSQLYWQCHVAAVDRRLLIKIEHLQQQNTELSHQVRTNTSLLQWLVGRFGGIEEATSQLPAGVTLPCQSMDDLHNLEVQIADSDVRTKVVGHRSCFYLTECCSQCELDCLPLFSLQAVVCNTVPQKMPSHTALQASAGLKLLQRNELLQQTFGKWENVA